MVVGLLIAVIAVVNIYYFVVLMRDLKGNFKEAMAEKGHPVFYAVLGFVSMFLSTLSISDYAINTLVYRGTKTVDDKLIPPTLNTESTIPCMVMALCYITTVKCDYVTLVVLVVAQTIGSVLSPRIVAKLPANVIRWFMGIGLGIAALMIFGNQIGFFPNNGAALGLSGMKLIIAAVCMFFLGAFNNIGIGAFAPTTALIYALGVSPLVAFPIMMGACACSLAVGSAEFVKLKNYARKPTFIFLVPGTLGVLCAAYVVTNINLYYLKWIVFVVVCWASADLIYKQLVNLKKCNIKKAESR